MQKIGRDPYARPPPYLGHKLILRAAGHLSLSFNSEKSDILEADA